MDMLADFVHHDVEHKEATEFWTERPILYNNKQRLTENNDYLIVKIKNENYRFLIFVRVQEEIQLRF